MKFVRAIWKLLVGIKDALVLLLLMLFFGGALRRAVGAAGAGQGRRARPQPQRQRGRTAGAARMGRRRRRLARIQQYRLRDLVAALDKAKDDSRVKAVALDLDGFTGGGQTAIGDLADAVRRVRAAGQAGGRLWRRLYRRQLRSWHRQRRKSGSTRWAAC